MKKSTIRNIILLPLLLSLLVGFSGHEKYLELSGYLNARSSAKFRKVDQNVLGLLEKGTRGEVLDRKVMASGNYGFKVEVLNGPMKGKQVWVYHNKSNPTLALYDVKPQDWEDIYREPAQAAVAAGIETIKETPAIEDPADPIANQEADDGNSQEAVKDILETSVEQTQGLLTSMRPVPRGNRTGCTECSAAADTTTAVNIAQSNRGTAIANACDALMDNKGKLGKDGQLLYKEMTIPRNEKVLLRDNAMGKLCPNFKFLSKGKKLKAWMWFWTVLAHEESRCNPQVPHSTHVNGKRINPKEGWGYWAMEKHQSDRAWRGQSCKGDMKNVGIQASCSVSIMRTTRLKYDHHSLTNGGSNYWGPLKRYKSQLLPKMKRFQGCF